MLNIEHCKLGSASWDKTDAEMIEDCPEYGGIRQIRSKLHPVMALIHEIPRFDSVFMSRNKALIGYFDICGVGFGLFWAVLLVGEGVKRD